MPTYAWVIVWVLVIATVAFFLVRERRSGRKGVDDFDRHSHEAVREAGIKADGRGPNMQGWN